MNDFIKSLNLEKNKDIEIRRKLSDWEENGELLSRVNHM